MSNVKPLFDIQKEGAPTAALDGHCPRCKTQLLWARKKYNMGIRTFYETCPKCLPESIRTKNPREATLQIELLQRNLEALTCSELSSSRDIRRIQMELQFIMIDIEETGSTSNLDTSNYKHLVNKLATCLEEKIDLMIASTRDEPPTLLEQVKELHADLVEQLKHQKARRTKKKSASVYALLDVMKQLELVVNDANMATLLSEEDCQEFRDEVDRLRIKLENAKAVLENIPAVSKLSRDVDTLSGRYLHLVQEMDRKCSENEESQELRKKMEEMERQHAAEVEALRAELNTFMTTTVAANVVAVEPVPSTQGMEQHQRVREANTASTSRTVAQAQIVGTMPSNRHFSTMTVEAEPLSATTGHHQLTSGGLRSVPETQVVGTTPINPHYSTMATEADLISANHIAMRHPASISGNHALEYLDHTDNVSEILHVMEEHPTSTSIQVAALKKLADLTRTADDNRRKISNAGGIDLILKATRQFPKDPNIQIHGLLAIGSVARNHKENSVEFGKKYGIELVLEGMRQFPNNIQVQRHGLFATYTLIFKNTEHKTRFRDLHGITLILRAMRRFPDGRQVQRNGLSCLDNLTSNNNENRTMIYEMGGIDVVLSAMHQFPKDIVTQDRGCTAIAFLAKSPKIQRELKRKGGIDIVKKAMQVIDNKSKSAVNALRGLESSSRDGEFAS